MHVYEVHAYEMHAREVHAHETLTNGGAVVDLSRSELAKTSFCASAGWSLWRAAAVSYEGQEKDPPRPCSRLATAGIDHVLHNGKAAAKARFCSSVEDYKSVVNNVMLRHAND